MEISLDWLREFAEVPPVDELCAGLARVGIEVDEVRHPTAAVSGVVVAEVLSLEPHPNADRLRVCQVTDGQARFTVVCGAANVQAGARVALAKIGATLPKLRIEARSVRGTASEGMLCSREELGLEEHSEGIWLLPSDWPLGDSVLEHTSASAVLVLSITPNRPDLLSHFGVAREVAAMCGTRLKVPTWRATEKGAGAASMARVLVDDPKGCRRYVARLLTNVKVGPSPAWLRDRLEQVGQRSINNVVDATNYVLMELGQPLHAFDLSRIGAESGLPTLRVRRAREGEPLVTLDGVTRTLAAEDLVIADANVPLALAGIMGGRDSEVTEGTTSILLESAYFDPVSVRRSGKRHGLHTEASRRFERGADPGISAKAADRCAQLITEIAGGEICKGALEVSKTEGPREIGLRIERVARLLGVAFAAETIVKLLEPLEIRCVARTDSTLRFQAPTYRPDLTREVDLIEEIARRHGYDELPETLPSAGGPYSDTQPGSARSTTTRQTLLAAGLSEVVTYGIGNPTTYTRHAGRAGEPVRIGNPLGEELSAVRTTLLPGLYGVVAHNLRQGLSSGRFFEVGGTARARPQTPADMSESFLAEQLRAGLVLFGGRAGGRWYEHGEQVDFSDLAGAVDALVDAFSPTGAAERRPVLVAGMHPRCACQVLVGGVEVGIAGQVHPDELERFGIAVPVFAAELDLDALAGLPQRKPLYAALGRFPGTRRDVAVLAAKTQPAEELRRFLQAEAGGALGPEVVESVVLFDVYAGAPVPPTHVSLAFAIDYRSRTRTLTDREVATAFESVLDALTKKFDVEIRQ